MDKACVVCGCVARQSILIMESNKQEAEGYPVCTQHLQDVKSVLRNDHDSIKVKWNETCN